MFRQFVSKVVSQRSYCVRCCYCVNLWKLVIRLSFFVHFIIKCRWLRTSDPSFFSFCNWY